VGAGTGFLHSATRMNDETHSIQILTRLELYFSIRHVNKAMKLFGPLFDHDYEMVAIFLTVAEVCLQALFHVVAQDPEAIDMEALYADANVVGMTALSIGEQTSIPRETVRRKLKLLTDGGFLAVSPRNKNIFLPTSTITSDRFLDLFEAHVKDISQLVRAVSYYQRART
jgi:hypothetical protein